MLSGDAPANNKLREEFDEALSRPCDTLEQVRRFYEATTVDLIHKNKRLLGKSYQIDVVKE